MPAGLGAQVGIQVREQKATRVALLQETAPRRLGAAQVEVLGVPTLVVVGARAGLSRLLLLLPVRVHRFLEGVGQVRGAEAKAEGEGVLQVLDAAVDISSCAASHEQIPRHDPGSSDVVEGGRGHRARGSRCALLQTDLRLMTATKFKLPDTIPESLRAELEVPLGFRDRCAPADLWPSFKAWLIKEGLEIHHKRSEEEDED